MGVEKRLFPHSHRQQPHPSVFAPSVFAIIVCAPIVCAPSVSAPSMSVISISAIIVCATSVSAPSVCAPSMSAVCHQLSARQMAECQAKVSPITGRIRRYKALRTEIQATRD